MSLGSSIFNGLDTEIRSLQRVSALYYPTTKFPQNYLGADFENVWLSLYGA